ncbi:CsgG/HfaB family protein [Megamonas hypermegale]|uniref:CsgG/HfaB family protein n=1 Tax=Megamonas hypermegale TaxID=158847 RepID=UPI00320878F6
MRKKNFLRLISLFVFMFILSGTFISEAATKKVAVGTFANGAKSRYGSLACTNLESNIFSGLVQNKNYEVVERAQLDQIFRELGLQNSGVVDSKSAIEIGHMSGADYTLVGKVLTAEVIPFDNVFYRGYKGKVAFEMHLVDNKTGLVMFSDVISDTDSQMYSPGVSVNSRNLISAAARSAATKVLEKMNEITPLTGTLLSVDRAEDVVYFDLGYDNGVREGDTYTVYKEGAPLVHPATGEILGIKETVLGTVKVKDVKSNYSIAEIKKEKGSFKTGDKIKRGE